MATPQICSKERPMPKDATGAWHHPDAVEGEQDDYGLAGGGSYVRFHCPNCGRDFKVELPD